MAGTKRKLSSKSAQGVKNDHSKKPKTKGTVHGKAERPARPAPEVSVESDDESGFEGFDTDDPWEGLVGSEAPESATDSLDISDAVEKNGAMKGKTSKAANETKKESAPRTQSPSTPKQSAKSDPGDGPKPVVTAGTSSKEIHAKQKSLRQERKAAKPNASGVERSKKLWERLRRKSHVPADERKQLVAELFEIITGHVKSFVFKHDAVRVVQTAIKYSNQEQRKAIARELQGSYLSLATGRYAKFLIGKLLVHGDREIRDMIIPEFYGHVRNLMRHPEAAWLLDDVYRGVANSKQKSRLLREWYGGEFAVLGGVDSDDQTSKLSKLLEKSPEKRLPIMRSLHETINRMVQKKTTAFTMLHDAMFEYFSNIKRGSDELTEFIELLKSDEDGDLLKNLAFTKSGSKVVCRALALGSAKDRKAIMRAYKDIIQLLAHDINAHTVLLAIFEVVDDTVLVGKVVIAGLIGRDPETEEDRVLKAATDRVARVALLYLSAGRVKPLLLPGDLALLEELDEARTETSRKEPKTRREELLKTFSPSLLKAVEDHAEILCQTSFGSRYIAYVLLGCTGDKARALETVADQAQGDPGDEGHVSSNPDVARMLKTLVQEGQFNAESGKIETLDPPLGFHHLLYQRIKPHVMGWATGPGSFVVVALLEAPGFTKRKEVVQSLKKNRKQLERAANNDGVAAKTTKARENGDHTEAPHASKGKNGNAGNRGAQILLDKLI